MRKPLPSERKVLRCIFNMYDSKYPGAKPGQNDPFIEIDIHAVAKELKCKPHLLFGYLYYYLEHKHGYQTGENSFVSLFSLKVGELRHAVNYPYLAAILASHDHEHLRYRWSLGLSLVALALSAGSIIAQLVSAK